MNPNRRRAVFAPALALAIGMAVTTPVHAVTVVSGFEDLIEGPLGDPFTHDGVTWHDLNTVSGIFPDGSTFGPQPEDQFIAEDAALLYAGFPAFGSPVMALTFGIAFVPGENLTIGPLSTVTLDLDGIAESASLDLAYYENGPWGGIEFHLDALNGGVVVASTSFVVSDLGGRDNPATRTLSVAAGGFTQLRLYATYGGQYSMPRAMVDDLAIEYVKPTAASRSTWGGIKDLYR